MSTSQPPSLIQTPIRRVLDADEEVFLLYTAKSSQSSSLGQVDWRNQEIVVSLDIAPEPPSSRSYESKHVEIVLAQDTSALRSRPGDTGSVLWRSSIEFTRRVLTDYYFPLGSGSPLIDPTFLRDAHVVELGAGTGFLGSALTSLVKHYTFTDLPALLPLIRKNIERNNPVSQSTLQPRAHGTGRSRARAKSQANKLSNIHSTSPRSYSIDALDWLEIASSRALRPSTSSSPYLSYPAPVSLILAVDCIYTTGPILPAFLTTLDRLTASTPYPRVGPDEGSQGDDERGTIVLIVSELRDEDVIREFLNLWLEIPGWEVWSVENEEEKIVKGPIAIWVGVKRPTAGL